MTRNKIELDPKIVEAEEDFLIDFQFLVQDLINSRRISRTELARKASISKARLSQILSAEANPTVRTFARLFHALDAKVIPKCMAERGNILPAPEKVQDLWEINRVAESSIVAPKRIKKRVDALLDWHGAANDNYFAVTGDTKSLVG